MIARGRLGLQKDEFFALTPRLFTALCREHREQMRERRALVALLQREIINFSIRAPKEPAQIDDLLPAEWTRGARDTEARPRRMTRKRREAVAERLRGLLNRLPGGLIVRNANGEVIERRD